MRLHENLPRRCPIQWPTLIVDAAWPHTDCTGTGMRLALTCGCAHATAWRLTHQLAPRQPNRRRAHQDEHTPPSQVEQGACVRLPSKTIIKCAANENSNINGVPFTVWNSFMFFNTSHPLGDFQKVCAGQARENEEHAILQFFSLRNIL